MMTTAAVDGRPSERGGDEADARRAAIASQADRRFHVDELETERLEGIAEKAMREWERLHPKYVEIRAARDAANAALAAHRTAAAGRQEKFAGQLLDLAPASLVDFVRDLQCFEADNAEGGAELSGLLNVFRTAREKVREAALNGVTDSEAAALVERLRREIELASELR
jgi:hypothetical protein